MALYVGEKRVVHPIGRKRRTISAFLEETGYRFRSINASSANPIKSYVGVLDYSDGALIERPSHMFSYCSSLEEIPLLDSRKWWTFNAAFTGCAKLKTIPALDTSSAQGFYYAFYNCSSLVSLPALDTSKVTDFTQAFYNCSSLTSIGGLDTSKATTLYYAFSGCGSLVTLPKMDTSKVTNFTGAFIGCSKLEDLSWLDLSSATNLSYMCHSCLSLKKFPTEIDCTNVTSIDSIFARSQLETLPTFKNTSHLKSFFCVYQLEKSPATSLPWCDTSNGTNFNSFLRTLTNVTEVPAYDMSKGTNFSSCFYGLYNVTAIHAFGFKASFSIDSCTKMDETALMEVLSNLGTLDTGKTATLTLGSTLLAKLTDDDKKIATDKGWTLA
jgi:surface protein